ncbi:hypothetical protein QBC43DRAFT_49380 [Cladorrhinum sp. PSN259]|nr:hypothetical protein QBC43DRAFT_49380 [Cladorrhinum sp. PSN259]
MRSSPLVLVALSQLVSAEWFVGQQLERYQGNDPLPRMTAASSPDGVNGWSPKPTEAPLVEDDESDSWDLLRRRSDQFVKMKRQSANTWTNQKTCGWFSRSLAEPFVCTASETCTTNTDRVVACETGGQTTGFFTMCFDYDAYTKGACSGMGPKTGCCWTSSIGACITYIWAGPTARSMYRCHTSPTIVTMLDVPRSALEATISTSSSSMIITSTSSTSSSSSGTSSSSSSTNTGTNSPDPDNKKKSNAGAIAGGVVGGLAGAAVLAGSIIFILIKRRGPKPSSPVNPSYSAVANPGDTSYGGGNPQQQQQQFSPGYGPQNNMTSPQMTSAAYFPPSTTLPPSTPYSNSTTPPGNIVPDPRFSYYDPSKFPEQQQQQQQFAGLNSPTPVSQYGAHPHTTPSPHNAGVVGGPYAAPGLQQGQYPPMPGQYQAYGQQQQQQQPHHFVSELDNTATVPQGQQGNPVEMDVNSPVQMSQQQLDQQQQQQQYQQQHQQQHPQQHPQQHQQQ